MRLKKICDFAAAYDREARDLRCELALEDDMPWRYDELSCGEQKKLQIACALWAKPDVLVLDEPTNHIDAAARSCLMTVLRHFDGIGIVVSHDRELLDGLVDRCASFEAGAVRVRPGGFTRASGQRDLERTASMRERRRAKEQLDRLVVEKDKRAHEAARADARMSKRHIDCATGAPRRKSTSRASAGKTENGVGSPLSWRDALMPHANGWRTPGSKSATTATCGATWPRRRDAR